MESMEFGDERIERVPYGLIRSLTLKHASEAAARPRGRALVVLAAVAHNDVALQYASEELQADREVVLTAIAKNGCALFHTSEELKADREVALASVCSDTARPP